jgi:hypothetical protein
MKMKMLCWCFAAVCAAIAALSPLQAETIPRDVIGAGGQESTNTSYQLLHTVGQPVIGVVARTGCSDEQGFWYSPWSFVTGVEDDVRLPKVYRLDQNFPNPFNPVTTIRFALVEASHVQLRIYDAAGRLVMTVVDREMDAGEHTVRLDARGLASGVYFYRIVADRFVKTKKMIVLR